jgi:ABC-2 type transport system ATP-binding protein
VARPVLESGAVSDTPVLQIRGLHKTFRIGFFRKRIEAVRGVNFEVRKGEIFGYVGHNGAGKTTTIKMALQLIHPDQGEIRIFDKPGSDPDSRQRIGYLPENPYIYTYLKPLEFLDLCGQLTGMPGKQRRARSMQMIERLGLADALDRPIGKFSKGMMQRLGICQALLHEPELVILDEPFSGLDPIGRKEIRELLVELREQGKTVMLTSHVLTDVEALADRVAILQRGKVVAYGAIHDLLRPEVRRVEVELGSVGPALRVELETLATKLRDIADRLQVVVEGEELVPRILKLALDSGARVLAVTPHRETLEDLFVREALRAE